MRAAPLSAPLDPIAREGIALLLDLPEDHVAAAFEQVRAGRAYRSFWIHRGKWRRVQMPDELLAALQRRVLTRVLATGPVSPAAYAGVRGRSVLAAAERHLRPTGEVLRLDLRDAYASTSYGSVSSALKVRLREELRILLQTGPERTRTGAALASFLTVRKEGGPGRMLPLGAPTSVATLNLVCRRMDREVLALLTDRISGGDAAYTRYVDDLVISSNRPLPTGIEAEINQIVEAHGYRLNPEKTCRQAADGAVVHGLVRGPRGPEPSPAVRARFEKAIRAHAEAFENPDATPAEREHSLAALRGIDGCLSRYYEQAGSVRPDSLRVAAPAGRVLAGVHGLDELWP